MDGSPATAVAHSIAPASATRAGPPPLKLFTSYAHEDEPYRVALEKHLMILKLQKLIEHWDDRQIVPGDTWENEIGASLENAHVIILLVSVEFVNSSYILNKEMQRALARAAAGQAVVVPVIVRVTEGWNTLPGLGSLQALPVNPGAPEEVLPIKSWLDPDEAWANVVRGLTLTIRKFGAKLTPQSAPAVAAPTASTPAAAEASAEGLKALRGWLDDPKVREVAEQFRADFKRASQRLLLLSDLKELHDLLHTLQFQCYSFLVLESRRSSEAEVSWESLDPPEITLGELTGKMQAIAQRASLAEIDLSWVKELIVARGELRAALSATVLKPFRSSVQRIGRVLAFQPTQINFQLSATAASLPLAEIEEGMAAARGQLGAEDLATPEGREIDTGVKALAKLRPGIARLTKEHTQWQALDAEMRLLESQVGKDTADLEFAWQGLRDRLLALCFGAPGTEWASGLQDEIVKLESALAAALPPRIAQAFRRTYALAGLRFYAVDVELLQLCEELRNLGTELQKLLTKL